MKQRLPKKIPTTWRTLLYLKTKALMKESRKSEKTNQPYKHPIILYKTLLIFSRH